MKLTRMTIYIQGKASSTEETDMTNFKFDSHWREWARIQTLTLGSLEAAPVVLREIAAQHGREAANAALSEVIEYCDQIEEAW